MARGDVAFGDAQLDEDRAEVVQEPRAVLEQRRSERRRRGEFFGALVGEGRSALAAHGVARRHNRQRVGRRQAEERAPVLPTTDLHLAPHKPRARELRDERLLLRPAPFRREHLRHAPVGARLAQTLQEAARGGVLQNLDGARALGCAAPARR